MDELWRLQSWRSVWDANPTFSACELNFVLCGIVLFIHACRSARDRLPLWLACVGHGIITECISYIHPDIDSFWHAQATLMFVGRRLPLYVLFLYPNFIYSSATVAKSLGLPRFQTALAVGIGALLMDLPYDLLGARFLWWTWHDTDPNIFDRIQYVPWTSFFFHMAFAFSHYLIFSSIRDRFQRNDGKHFPVWKEIVPIVAASLFSFPLGVLQFIPIYHGLHDNLGVETSYCVWILFAAYVVLGWEKDIESKRDVDGKRGVDEIVLVTFIHHVTLLLVGLTGEPKQVVSEGVHQAIGDCDAMSNVYTPLGQSLPKKTFLCPTNYDEPFDIGPIPKDEMSWYTIRGRDHDNFLAFGFILALCCFTGLVWVFELYKPASPQDQRKKKKKQK